MRYSIVGQKWLDLDPYLTGIGAGVPAVLVREPKNPADPNAVAVYINGSKVGFLRKEDAARIAPIIDRDGRDFGVDVMAMDGLTVEQRKAIDAKFVRSANSSYPQIELD